ncbi:MAG: hypothetical protein H6753_03295 [Candidatus Omnitrophica bacterium]|nr:hypothetical protein [Candidatus Omnitrophota bacterium]
MMLFYMLILILVIGTGAIAWIMLAEKKKESPPPPKTKETAPQLSPKDLLERLGLENPKPESDKIILPELFKKPVSPAENQANQLATTAKTNPLPTITESELSLKYDELLSEKTQLKAEYTKLEALFIEKSMLLEKSEKTLNNELKNQKEFNKVKDILEKEIRDYKDKVTALQGEITIAQTETQTQSKRVIQLEEKIKKFEIEVLTSEAAINDAQASTQLARKHSSELEEKIRALENQILDKNQKIEDLVSRLKDLPNIFPGNALPNPQAALEQHTDVETISKTSEQPVWESSSENPDPQPPSTSNVVQQGGEQHNKLSRETPISESPEKELKEAIPANIEAPATVPLIDQQTKNNAIIEKSTDGALTLPPDILAKQEIESIKPLKSDPADPKP